MANELTVRITTALEAGDFESAEPLLARFFGSLETNLTQISPMQDRASTLQEALGCMHRWLSLSQVVRSHLNEQIRCNVRDASYLASAGTLSTVEFTG